MSAMTFLIIVAFLATLGSLFMGGISMAMGGEYDDQHSNDLMQARTILHAITLGLILIAVLIW